MIRLFLLALIADGVTKHVALQQNLPHVFNLGQDHGPMGYELQLILTGASLVFFVWLAQDARLKGAREWIGCVVGGGVANVLSIISGPPGVLDVSPLGSIMANVADLFIWLGLAGITSHLASMALAEVRAHR